MPRKGAPPPFRDRLAGAALLALTAGIRRLTVVRPYGLADFAALLVVGHTLLHERRAAPTRRLDETSGLDGPASRAEPSH